MAAIHNRSTRPFGADGRDTCRPGKRDFRPSIARSLRSICSIKGCRRVSDAGTMRRGGRLAIWLLVVAGLVAIGVANWHLVHVAISTAPDCVAHVRLGEGRAAQ